MKIYDISVGNQQFFLTQGAYDLAVEHCTNEKITLTVNSEKEYMTALKFGDYLFSKETNALWSNHD